MLHLVPQAKLAGLGDISILRAAQLVDTLIQDSLMVELLVLAGSLALEGVVSVISEENSVTFHFPGSVGKFLSTLMLAEISGEQA